MPAHVNPFELPWLGSNSRPDMLRRPTKVLTCVWVSGESKVKLSGTLIRYSNEFDDGDMTINSVLAKISYQEHQSRYRDLCLCCCTYLGGRLVL